MDASVESPRGGDGGRAMNVLTIGINCDAENTYNKDPKDPNKYEVEGQKTQSTTAQLVEYYVKLL